MKNEIELQILGIAKILGTDFTMYGDINNPLFLAKDVADCIKHTNLTMMLKGIDPEEQLKTRPKHSLGLLTNNNEYNFLTEDGLYEVCMQSRKPIAKQMKKEIKSYLKQIRLTGGVVEHNREEEFVENYFPSLSDDTKKAIIIDLQKKNEQLMKQNKELKYDADLANDLIKSKGLLTLKQVADSIEIGRTKLCSLLRQKNILSKQTGYNEPMGKYIKSTYFKTIVEEDERTKHVSIVTLVTPKGLKFIYRLIKKNELLDEFDTTKLLEVSTNA